MNTITYLYEQNRPQELLHWLIDLFPDTNKIFIPLVQVMLSKWSPSTDGLIPNLYHIYVKCDKTNKLFKINPPLHS